ncbi:hypothetical protein WJX72_001527 [[Myrmecia] bisecta]|uniref:TIP41-like protein n=1 Tax=[Myrmecia] bisecta TaxID=41462 RepID=A0AAW1P5J4_9CHLO
MADTIGIQGPTVNNSRELSICGWKVTSCKAPILKDSLMDRCKSDLAAPSLPEQLFADSYLKLVHAATGTCLYFSAIDGLRAWIADTPPPVRVGIAQDWLSTREADVKAHNAKTQDYDWTYSTPYHGSLRTESNSQASTSDPKWVPSPEPMNRAPLMARDPILFYEEVPLYESELDDHGVSQLSVKVRVMPTCWFVLLRFWLRVDKVLVRLRETRIFCDFKAPPATALVTREIRHCEGTFEELKAAGAPGDGAAYADADSASLALQAVAPAGVTQFSTEKLVLRKQPELM